ncbi:MAG: hypothetical protein KDA58_14650 [Planctomycetaceae bacterium]|nr:hypothetical protein [Planctomycetaceae bacterium]
MITQTPDEVRIIYPAARYECRAYVRGHEGQVEAVAQHDGKWVHGVGATESLALANVAEKFANLLSGLEEGGPAPSIHGELRVVTVDLAPDVPIASDVLDRAEANLPPDAEWWDDDWDQPE